MSFFEELKRRNVFRVGIAYLIFAWLMLQVTDIVGPILDLPDVFSKSVLLLLAISFPLAVFLAWAFELTPEGVTREKNVDRSKSITPTTGRKLDFIIIGVLLVAVAIFALDKFVWSGGASSEAEFAENLEVDKSIAVLPFANRSADDSDAYFVDGIHDDILTQLHKVSGIDKVISRTSVERYRNTELSIPEIAAELGVSTILEGSVQRVGDRVRITVQLIGATNDEHLWAENFDRELTTANVFEIQSEISTAIAKSLQAALSEPELIGLSDIPTENLAAYDAYLLGKYTMKSRDLDDLAQARVFFEEAVDHDPEFSLAYVGIADSINLRFGYEIAYGNIGLDAEEVLSVAELAAKQALEINDRLGEAYASLGYTSWLLAIRSNSDPGWALRADLYFRSALEYSPNYADSYRWYTQLLWMSEIGRPLDSLVMAERAVELDPMVAVNHTYLGMAKDINGDFEGALVSFDRGLELAPDLENGLSLKLDTLLSHGKNDEVIVAGIDFLERNPDSPSITFFTAASFLRLGMRENFQQWSVAASEGKSNLWADLKTGMDELERRNWQAAVEQYSSMLSDIPKCHFCVFVLSIPHKIGAQPEALLAFLGEHAGHLLDPENPRVAPQNLRVVPYAVWALLQTGQTAHARRLVEAGLEVARTSPRVSGNFYGSGIADAEMHALLGNNQFALDALVEAVNQGYRFLDSVMFSPFLEPLREKPEFVAAVDVIRADLAAQAERVRELQRNGELPTAPR